MALKFVTQSVSTVINGQRVRLTKDDPWRDDDPVVKGAPQFFGDEPTEVQSSLGRSSAPSPVEQATAAPGELRTADKPPRKRTASKE